MSVPTEKDVSPDKSYLDKKYFINPYVYNCPFCNRRNLSYELDEVIDFDWNNDKKCYVHFVICSSCDKSSMHLSYDCIAKHHGAYSAIDYWSFNQDIDIDEHIFYSVPTSFFVLDKRIPKIIRELISEAEGSLKMNFLTGASACMRKAIYELFVREKVKGEHYGDKIKALKGKGNSPSELH
ncbi:MAG: hypothetical protein IIA61_14280 [Candidatus Marinimicrobia bacterium]|nr:hypothetical protein [Candidatus Neomarinimicrobiota bacterium]